ncbi:DNA-3-methyladenine glycosylase I [Raoultibacter phocaeensis]|uniref:DNA-3-methyladenine glycosylase I n=1 Tax=Raoultibacter phocaeensis TaxID=2479841 RepID=UPI0011192486|nr:DNA-3-methyladenine glycosylase I [Raoultibacter phocaeensis]
MEEQPRCSWPGDIPIYVDYHDNEWGRPSHDDRELFELLILEGAQAGLSWITILKKREAYRKAFDDFDPVKVSRYDEKKVEELMENEGIIRNRLKINAAIANAKLFLDIVEEFGSFDAFLWGYVDGAPIVNRWESEDEIPASTPLSDRISKDLKKRGFKFVGSTIMYAYMQSIGMVNDHVTGCFVYRELAGGPAVSDVRSS